MINRKILTAVLIVVLVAAVAGGYIYLSHTEENLEPFQETSAESSERKTDETRQFRYLKEYTLKTEEKGLKVYLPQNVQSSDDRSKATAELNGITITAELILDDITDTERLTTQGTENRISDIEILEGVQDIVTEEIVSKNDSSIQQTGYSINDENGTLYPCIVIIKTDKIEKGVYLRVTIMVDNTSASEKTSSLLSEIAKAYGMILK